MPVGLNTVLNDNWIPRRSGEQDEASNSGPASINVIDGWVKYVNNGLVFSDGNMAIFDTATGHIDVSSLPMWSKIDFILTTNITMNNPNGYINVKVVIPDTEGDILVSTTTINPVKIVAHDKTINIGCYIGAKALEFGFDIYTSVEVSSAIFANRRISLRV